jgi:hypothetical protein
LAWVKWEKKGEYGCILGEFEGVFGEQNWGFEDRSTSKFGDEY